MQPFWALLCLDLPDCLVVLSNSCKSDEGGWRPQPNFFSFFFFFSTQRRWWRHFKRKFNCVYLNSNRWMDSWTDGWWLCSGAEKPFLKVSAFSNGKPKKSFKRRLGCTGPDGFPLKNLNPLKVSLPLKGRLKKPFRCAWILLGQRVGRIRCGALLLSRFLPLKREFNLLELNGMGG